MHIWTYNGLVSGVNPQVRTGVRDDDDAGHGIGLLDVSDPNSAPGEAPFADGEWHHYCLTSSAARGGEVYIDGELAASVNMYSAETTYHVVIFDIPGLQYGDHVLTVEALATGNHEVDHNFVNIDAFEVR